MKRSLFIAGTGRFILLLPVLLALSLCPAARAHAYTTYEVTRTLVAAVHQTCTITAWHYSGGYWIADSGSGSPRVRIPDKTVSSLGFAATLSESIYAKWTIKVPEEVQKARRNGAVIVTDVPERGQYYSSIQVLINGASELRINAVPIIRICSRSLKDYVPGIRADIPLVSREHGRNLYALYGKGLKGTTAPGAYSESQPYRIYEPYIHPTMIKNAIGTLAAGGSVYAGGKTMPSKGLSVGFLTLIKGGAVGVQFEIPITVYFYEETLVPVTHETAVPEADDTGTAVAQEPDSVETKQEERPVPEEVPTPQETKEKPSQSDPAKTQEPAPVQELPTWPAEQPKPDPTEGPAEQKTEPEQKPQNEPQTDVPAEPEKPLFSIEDQMIHRAY